MIDLVKRLRTMAATGWNPIGDEAADTITALRAENERLKAALQSWDDAVVVNLVMEGPRFNGVRWNKAAAAWELTRAALEEKQ